MYNGIGLQSARGSGTSGHVQKNISTNVKKMQSKQQFLKQLQEKRKNNLPPPRKANEAIIEHERKREIMIQMIKLREKLLTDGLSTEQIELKVKKAQDVLRQKLEAGRLQTKTTDTHVLTQAKQKEYMKLSKAFGVVDKRSIGSSFDFEAQRQEKLKRQYEKSVQPSFQCLKDQCGKVYREKELLDRHLKYKHPEMYEEVKKLEREKDTKQKLEINEKHESDKSNK